MSQISSDTKFSQSCKTDPGHDNQKRPQSEWLAKTSTVGNLYDESTTLGTNARSGRKHAAMEHTAYNRGG